MKAAFTVGLMAGLLLSACQTAIQSRTELFDCGDIVYAEFQREGLHLTRNGRDYDLQSVSAASGARYTTLPGLVPQLTFWNKGDEARLQWEDEPAVVCQRLSPPELPLTARGQEPGWLLKMHEDQLDLQYQYGEQQYRAATPEPQIMAQGYRYRTQSSQGDALTLTISPHYCTDVMSGMPYPYRAHLKVEDQTLEGCAGDSRKLLVGREWVVTNISGESVAENAQPTLEFTEDGKLYGHAGCNRYSGHYQLTGEGLSVGPLISTKMACAKPLMQQENRLLGVLQSVKRFEVDKSGALRVRGDEGQWLIASP